MPTKKKPAHGRTIMSKPAPRPPIRANDPSWPHLAQMLGEIVAELHYIGQAIIDSRPRPGPLPEPSEFVSGGFHRRSGDIYQSVAEPGTPNAGVTPNDPRWRDIGADNADNPSRPVRSPVERGD